MNQCSEELEQPYTQVNLQRLESILDLSEAVDNQDDFIVRPFKAPKKKVEKQKSKKKEPIELSEDKVLDTKFTLSVQTMVAAGTGLASLIGMWYTLQGEIEEAKQLPSLESLYLKHQKMVNINYL